MSALGQKQTFHALAIYVRFLSPNRFRASECLLSGVKRTLWRTSLNVRLWPEADIRRRRRGLKGPFLCRETICGHWRRSRGWGNATESADG